tara:strand:+ start:1852 stop:2481 length:630 start_codon:yes stop_codon:yes gene_type:complete
MALKHVGRIAGNKRKVIVAYRVIPGDPDYCLVVQTENLSADEHDSLIKAVEGSAGQEAYEFSECMARTYLPDGRNMLAGFQTTGKLNKILTSEVEMTPNANTVIALSELNSTIAEQQGVTVADLALKGPDGTTVQPDTNETEPAVDPVSTYTNPTTTDDGILSDDQLAAQYRSQADALFKEAKKLREQAEELAPTKKRTTAKKTEASAA